MKLLLILLIILGLISITVFIGYIYLYKMFKSIDNEDDDFYSRSCHK
jgi:hypothetical protein